MCSYLMEQKWKFWFSELSVYLTLILFDDFPPEKVGHIWKRITYFSPKLSILRERGKDYISWEFFRLINYYSENIGPPNSI